MNIERKHVTARKSEINIHNGTVYLAGQVAKGDTVADQTRAMLAQVDALLAEAGSSREHILQATIWLADMADFEEMNSVWDAWIPVGHAPGRACGEAVLASPDFRVEVIIIAAVA